MAAPAAAVRTALAAAKGALLLFSTSPFPLCRRPQPQRRGPGVHCQDPDHHLSRVGGSAATRAGRLGSGGLCPRCWNAYLIHHVHVGQQQHQQCGGREEPASKGGRRGGVARDPQNSPDGLSSAPRAPRLSGRARLRTAAGSKSLAAIPAPRLEA